MHVVCCMPMCVQHLQVWVAGGPLTATDHARPQWQVVHGICNSLHQLSCCSVLHFCGSCAGTLLLSLQLLWFQNT